MSLIHFEQGQCKRVSAQLDSFVSGELRAEDAAVVRRHLDACESCRQAAADRSRLKNALRDAVMKDQAPLNLRYRIQRDIRKSSSPLRWINWSIAAAAAIVMIAGVFGLIRFTNRQHQSHRSAQAAVAIDQLLNVGLSDHVRCAIDHGMANRTFTPEQMISQLGPQFAEVVDVTKRNTGADFGITVAHRCHVDGREFVHLILKSDNATASLIVTKKNDEAFPREGIAAVMAESGIPVYQDKIRDFEVAGFETSDYLIFVASSLPESENLHLASHLAPAVRDFLIKLEA